MNADLCLETVASAPRRILPELRAALWRSYASGQVSEAEATRLSEAIEARAKGPSTLCQPAQRRPRFSPGVRGERMRHRRRLAASGPLPPNLACLFTLAELAVLRVVGDEWRTRGQCTRSHVELADRAQVSPTTVKRALAEARRLGLVEVLQRRVRNDRNLPNIVRVISPEWSTWLRRRKATGGVQTESAIDTKDLGEGWGIRRGGVPNGVRKKADPDPGPARTAPSSDGQWSPRPSVRRLPFAPFSRT